jgi:MscS family membrane protein
VTELMLALGRVLRALVPIAAALVVTASARAADPAKPEPSGKAWFLTPMPRVLTGPDQPLRDKLRSPRDTLQTLYYSIDVYDFFPAIIQDAVATLDLGDSMPADSASASLLAVQLEGVLNSLDIPLAGVPDRPTVETITVYDADDIKIVLRKYTDGCWRFDRETVQRTPAMRRTVLARQKSLIVERANLREGYTDARTTAKRFICDSLTGDFSAASRALDLGGLSTAQRRENGSALAQMLAFVLQRRGYTYSQLFPENPAAGAFTWHADRDGRIMLRRVPTPDGKDAWLFDRTTVAQLPQMYAAAQPAIPDIHFARLGLVVPPINTEAMAAGSKRPDSVPHRLGSPRAMLRTFFRAMDAADSNDAKIVDALECLDLGAIPDKDRRSLGTTIAQKLEAVLRAVSLDLAAVPDSWDAPAQVLGATRGFKIDIVRQQDGTWRFGENSVAMAQEMFDKLESKERSDRERIGQLESARDTTVTFFAAFAQDDMGMAARCLDLSEYFPGAENDLGPVLAYKLKYILDRTGRIYMQEIPDDADGPRYALYRGELGQIVVGRKTTDSHKGMWLFTPETVKHIEPMFRKVLNRPVDRSLRDADNLSKGPRFLDAPGVWLRQRLPEMVQKPFGPLDCYQWIGLGVTLLFAGAMANVILGQVHILLGFLLRQSGSCLTRPFVAQKLRPMTWLMAAWLIFHMATVLDLPVASLDAVLALKKFLLAGLVAWCCFGVIDLALGIYMNSELLRPHRSLSDLIVPVSMRALKGVTLVLVATYVVYEVGQGDMLTRFLTGLGVAGLAASLAAQDALKSFFGTLLLIGERSFKIGDRVQVDNKTVGTIEQVGFRSTKLRTDEGSLVTVPNATLASASINNFGLPAKAA